MEKVKKGILIGKVAERTGVAVSAIRFYEEAGLIQAGRNSGGQRVFEAADIRRISFIIIAQKLGFSLKVIKTELDSLPNGRTPTLKDWEKISQSFGANIDKRIEDLARLKQKLTGCMGCGCLSLQHCALYNTDDKARENGPGPQFLL
ncbi:MerR family transcriptional regulator [Litorimonas taeanensis]|uniref:MerR family transcriptional regulator n=1 Tax=Litorimonas taeanensis TaxID=568099 RepID=A0A420WLD0_9PROT|nr:redox-sensitive transcriptional activator SoxR [Litorimonas taeanensis]RKQ71851.1 MerR family transcriptional regulator [Litorimonas taeanensis]